MRHSSAAPDREQMPSYCVEAASSEWIVVPMQIIRAFYRLNLYPLFLSTGGKISALFQRT